MNIIRRFTAHVRRIGIGRVLVAILLPVIVAVAMRFGLALQIDEQEARNQELRVEIRAQERMLEDVQSLADALSEAVIRRQFLENTSEAIEMSIALLSKLSHLPIGVSLDSVTLDADRLRIMGRAATLSDIGATANDLHNAQETDHTVVLQSQLDENGNYTFVIVADVLWSDPGDAQ